MRDRRKFAPPPAFKDSKLIVVACEDTDATYKYLLQLARYFEGNSHVTVHPLDPKERRGNDPEKVWVQLCKFEEKNGSDDDVEFWAVVDVDQYEPQLSQVARQCETKPNFHLAVSNPAIEIWFLLHFRDIAFYDEAIREELLENYKVDGEGNRKPRAERTRLEREIIETNPKKRYKKGDLHVEDYLPRDNWREVLEIVIERAIKLDIDPDSRWPQQLGTRVYQLMQSILRYRSQLGELYV